MDSYRLLGSVVLFYAFLTFWALRSISFGFPEAVIGVLWLVYALGALGLSFGKGWGRAVTLIAAGGSLIAMVTFLAHGGLDHFFVPAVWALGGLPALAIFLSALLVESPVSNSVEPSETSVAAPKSRISRRRWHDIAYVAFILLGLIATWTSFLTSEQPDIGVVGFFVMIPFGIQLWVALILGLGITVALRTDVRLMALSALSIVMLLFLLNFSEEDWPIPLALYAGVCIATGLVWFLRYRARLAATIE